MRRIDWLIGLAMLVGMFSCSVTKNLPDDEILYTGIDKVVVQEMDSTQAGEAALEEIRAALDYPPNNALLGSSTVRLPLPFGCLSASNWTTLKLFTFLKHLPPSLF